MKIDEYDQHLNMTKVIGVIFDENGKDRKNTSKICWENCNFGLENVGYKFYQD